MLSPIPTSASGTAPVSIHIVTSPPCGSTDRIRPTPCTIPVNISPLLAAAAT